MIYVREEVGGGIMVKAGGETATVGEYTNVLSREEEETYSGEVA